MKVLLVILCLFVAVPGRAQVRPRPVQPHSDLLLKPQDQVTPQSTATKALFKSIERGILNSSTAELQALFARQVFMTISGNESGYYSSGQASLILQNFFSTRKPTQFSFTRTNETASNPYATGRLTFIRRGGKESVQVYVSVARQDSQWVITQFNIY